MVNTLLIGMYGKGGALEETPSTFEDMCDMTVVSWNTLSEAYCSNYQGEGEEAFHRLLNCNIFLKENASSEASI